MTASSSTRAKMFIAALRQLPPLMRQVVNNQALVDNMIAIDERYRLTPSQADALMAIERAVIIQDLPVTKISEEIAKIGMPSADVAGLTRDFLGRIILPMSWHVGNVEPIIQQLGGRTEEYLLEARQQFPEVYAPPSAAPAPAEQPAAAEHLLLRNFEDKIATPRGRADLLLRLTGLAGQVDELMQSETISQTDGEELLRNLDTLSYAVNARDLNPLEVQSLKRRLRKVLGRLTELSV